MMLWLLATLSVVTISWGIAHRLKAGSEGIARASGARVVSTTAPDCAPLLAPKPKDDPPTLERALSV